MKTTAFKVCLGCNKSFYKRPHSHYCLDCKLGQEKPKVKRCMVCDDLARNDRSMLCQKHFDEQLQIKVREA
jgi:hypothetical protein